MLSMEKKLELWEKELPPDKLALIAYAVNAGIKDEANKRVDSQMNAIKYGLTSAIRSSLYELFSFSIEDVEQVITKANEYLKDKEKFLEKWGVEWMNKIEELEPKIKEEIKRLTKGIEPDKINRLEVVKKIQRKFNIPLDNANEIFWMVKEESFEEEQPKQYKSKSSVNKAKSTEEKQSNVITPKEEKKANTEAIDKQNKETKSIFEIVEKKIVLKTPNGTYEKVNEGVKFLGELYKNTDEANKHRKNILANFESDKMKIIQEMQRLENELSMLEDREKTLNIVTQEIIAAFAYEC